MKTRGLVQTIVWLVINAAFLLLGNSCQASKDNLVSLGPFTPGRDKVYETKPVPGLTSDVISYKHSWQGLDETLWIKYIVRDNQVLYVSRKVGSFAHLTVSPFVPNPVVNACVTIEMGIESELGELSPEFRQWLLKCMSAYFSNQPFDSVFTEKDMNYRFTVKERDVFLDYAKSQTMNALSNVNIRE